MPHGSSILDSPIQNVGEEPRPLLRVRDTGPSMEPDPLNGRMHGWRLWMSAVKAAPLFLLPFPLVFAVLAAMIAADPEWMALTAGALACFWGAGALSWRALVREAEYTAGNLTELSAFPLKLLSGVFTAVGAALAAIAGGHSDAGAAMFAVLGGAGYFSLYGLDMKPRKVEVSLVEGVDVASVARELEHAYRRVRRIEAAARDIAMPEFRERLKRIATIGKNVLGEIEHDPRKAARARRFLHVYTESTERVVTEYARTHQQIGGEALAQNFRQLLIDMESSFAEQHRKLLQNDVVSLDVEIEVLNARLKQGLGDRLEIRG